ncbi:MAG: hypothetical protein CL565_04775 [Alphaproteobacteria bacterium]|nr:hypothetical protein [Alphaproteobacteria bacterium]
MNLFAACAVMFSIFYQWNLASAIIQTSWILISLYGLGRCLGYSRPYRLDPRPAKRTFLFLKRNLPDSVEILPRDQKAEK